MEPSCLLSATVHIASIQSVNINLFLGQVLVWLLDNRWKLQEVTVAGRETVPHITSCCSAMNHFYSRVIVEQ